MGGNLVVRRREGHQGVVDMDVQRVVVDECSPGDEKFSLAGCRQHVGGPPFRRLRACVEAARAPSLSAPSNAPGGTACRTGREG
jgi:hypothetical protein